jgi:hypothetical protein
MENDRIQATHSATYRNHEHVRTSYQSPTSSSSVFYSPVSTSGGSIDSSPSTIATQYSPYTVYPPTPVSGGYNSSFTQQSYSPTWSISPMQLGVPSPAQQYYQYYPAAYPAYPYQQYQYQSPVDYSTASHQQYMMSYGYPTPMAPTVFVDGQAEHTGMPAPADQDTTDAAEQSPIQEQEVTEGYVST